LQGDNEELEENELNMMWNVHINELGQIFTILFYVVTYSLSNHKFEGFSNDMILKNPRIIATRHGIVDVLRGSW